MPRAHRYFLPDQVWHLTHRCHDRQFLLKFAHDRHRYLRWLFEAKKRFGFCVLDYIVTSNHVHLLVKDTGEGVIAKSVQLVAGRTAQEYNQRKNRHGPFWEDRYHATAIEADEHLHRCLLYIDLNMVRAGVINHPVEWAASGYGEIQAPPRRYAIIDLPGLSSLCGYADVATFQLAHRQWVAEALAARAFGRDDRWSQAIAVGRRGFVDHVQDALGSRARHREVTGTDESFTLREPQRAYAADFHQENEPLRAENTFYWEQ